MDRKEREQFIFGMIFYLSNQLQVIADKDGGELTLKQWFLLIMITKIENKSPTINLIADFMGYTRQNAKKILLLLEEKGFVQINKSINDSRAQNISLTEKSVEYFSNTKDFGNKLLDDLFHGLDNNKINSLFDSFQVLSENINRMKHEKE